MSSDNGQEKRQEQLEYVPDLIEGDGGFVYDEGKLHALVRHVLEHAEPEDRAYAMAHPGLDLRPRDDMLEVVVAHDGRVLGGFEAKLLLP